MFANIGTTEILIIAFVLLIFFGGSQLPRVVQNLAESDEKPKEKSGNSHADLAEALKKKKTKKTKKKKKS